MIGTLGRSLGVSLFGRTVHGLSLTADGSRYLESCQPVLEQLAAADEALRGAAVRPRGTLVVGTSPIISQHCILPALPLFHARSEEHTSELQSLMRISYAVFCLKTKMQYKLSDTIPALTYRHAEVIAPMGRISAEHLKS